MFCAFCVAYFQGASKSVHLNDFLNNFYVNYPFGTKFSEIIKLHLEFCLYRFTGSDRGVVKF